MISKHIVLASMLIASGGSAALAQATEDGKNEFMTACAGCHGETAMGDGPFAPLLNIEVPGLTGLAADNEGVFPWLDVFLIVDGRTGVRGHGEIMPIWGDRFSASARESFGEYGAEVVTRGRIAVLVDYLESIQQ